MRILLTCFFPYYFSGVSEGGGVAHYITLLKQKLEQLGHTVDFFGFDEDKTHFWIPRVNSFLDNSSLYPFIESKLLPYFKRHYPHMYDLTRVQEISKHGFELAAAYCDLGSYDVIHAQDVISSRAIWRVKPPHVPLITTVHGIIPYEQEIRGVVNRELHSALWRYYCTQERIGLASNNWLVVTSKWTKEVVTRDFGALPESLSVIQNGMDIEPFVRRMNEEPSVWKPAGRKVIACVARHDKEKGIIYLLEALFRLKQERSDWECWLIGEGPDRMMLEQTAVSYGLAEHVKFLGHRGDVPALLKQCDVLAMPSLQENCPYVIMEAQVAGVPVVAAHTGGIPDMITNEATGLLFERANSFELYMGLKRMLEDEVFRHQIANQAMTWGRVFWSFDERLKALIGLYMSASGREVLTVSSISASRKRAAAKKSPILARRRRKTSHKIKGKASKRRLRRTASRRPGKGKLGSRRLRRTVLGKLGKRRLRSRPLRRRLVRSTRPAAAYDELYRSLFQPRGSQPLMDVELWRFIRDRLPSGYSIPDRDILA